MTAHLLLRPDASRRVEASAAAEDRGVKPEGLDDASVRDFVRRTGGAAMPTDGAGNPDFDSIRIDDAYYEEMGIPEVELEAQQAWGANDTDPEGQDIDIAGAAGARVAEDTPQYLLDELADEPEPYGPPKLLLAGFHVEEAAFLRVILDSAGGSAVGVVELTPAALHGRVADAVQIPEMDWSSPRPAEAAPAGGGWGSQRVMLTSGLRTVDIATALELLEESGLTDVCVAVAQEAEADRIVGEVLAEAVKATRGRARSPGAHADELKRSGRMTEKLPAVEEIVAQDALDSLKDLEGDDDAVDALFEAAEGDFELSLADIKAAAAARRATTPPDAPPRPAPAAGPVPDPEPAPEDAGVLDIEAIEAVATATGPAEPAAVVEAEFSDAAAAAPEREAERDAPFSMPSGPDAAAPDVDLDALVEGAELPSEIAAREEEARARAEARAAEAEAARRAAEAAERSGDAAAAGSAGPPGSAMRGGVFVSEEKMKEEVKKAVQAALKGPEAARSPAAAAALEEELEKAEAMGFNRLEVLSASNTMDALEAALEAGLEPDTLKEYIDALAAEKGRTETGEGEKARPAPAFGPADYNGEMPEPLSVMPDDPAVPDAPSQLNPLTDARDAIARRTHYTEAPAADPEGPTASTPIPMSQLAGVEGEEEDGEVVAGTNPFVEAAQALVRGEPSPHAAQTADVTYEDDAAEMAALLAASEAPYEIENATPEVEEAPPAQTMSRAQLEETASRHGLDLDELLSDMEARGITLED